MLPVSMPTQFSPKTVMETPVMFGLGITIDGRAPVYLLDQDHYPLNPEPVCVIDMRCHQWFADWLISRPPAWRLEERDR